jgi:hypothetical protein
MYIIAVYEPLEYFKSYQKWLTGADGEISRLKIVMVRITGCCVVMACTLISDDVVTITGFSGNLFTPLCSFIIPIVLAHSKAWIVDGKVKHWALCFHDGFFLIFSVGMTVYGTYDSIDGIINGKGS